MADTFSILVTDRNRRVRTLLKRELESEGYMVYAPETYQEALALLRSKLPLHWMVLDVEVLEMHSSPEGLKTLMALRPGLKAVVHSFEEYREALPTRNQLPFVAKRAGSVEKLKAMARSITRSSGGAA